MKNNEREEEIDWIKCSRMVGALQNRSHEPKSGQALQLALLFFIPFPLPLPPQ
jgi:hypothetical protein